MPPKARLLLGTGNAHKAAELRAILGDVPFEIVDLSQIPTLPEPDETGSTFEENAVLKACAYADASGMLALADDSGLEIDALGGEPGVYSARWQGAGRSYLERFQLIEERLQDVPDERRTARFRCVIAIAAPAPRGLIGTASGSVEGLIASHPQGTNGFGYDPIFFVPELGKTFGQATVKEKESLSHRARAARQARPLLLALGDA